jgi:hypothetical protein
MSCFCPSGYTPTIDLDDCIYTTTAATSGGTYFYTGVNAVNISVYCEFGVFFYEDITNLSFPITTSGTTGTTTTENGTTLFSTQFMVDNSGRILNIQAGGNGAPYGPTSIQNSLWGTGIGTTTGRLNNAGIWATSVVPGDPINEWLGFSYCLDIVSGGTYFIGVASDNLFKLTLNNQLLVQSDSTNFDYSAPLGMPGTYIGFNSWSVFPITLSSGLNIIQMESLNLTGNPLSNYAAFAAEIYSGSVSTLSGYTSYSQLSADTIFSTLDFIGQDIPLSSSGATTNTGYTCPDGYSLYTCSGTPYCIFIDKVGLISFCISDTGLGYDDNFTLSGIYNSEPYWSGSSTSRVIYLTSGGMWCLSDTLGGTCLLEGTYPCTSTCPDLCDTYFSEGICPTPTPTPTINCSVLDFTAIFDCDYVPTPTPTPTNTATPTTTPTPTPSNPCGGIAVDVTITGYTPTPTPTITTTPTPTPEITRPISILGNVTFNTINGEIKCPNSKQFQDCYTGEMYYTTNSIPLPSGGTIDQFMIFKGNVNGNSKCISFVGYNLDVIGIDNITLIDGPLGYSNIGECTLCVPDVSPTPTPTMTPSVTPTITPSPTPSMAAGYYVFRQCGNPTEYIIQTLAIPTFTPGDIFKTITNDYCWEFMYYSSTYPTLPLGSTFTFITGSFFPSSGNTFFSNCTLCLSSL